jgi:hypothetical protein
VLLAPLLDIVEYLPLEDAYDRDGLEKGVANELFLYTAECCVELETAILRKYTVKVPLDEIR